MSITSSVYSSIPTMDNLVYVYNITPSLKGRGGGGGGGQQASCLVPKQAVESPQVLTSWYDFRGQSIISCIIHEDQQ